MNSSAGPVGDLVAAGQDCSVDVEHAQANWCEPALDVGVGPERSHRRPTVEPPPAPRFPVTWTNLRLGGGVGQARGLLKSRAHQGLDDWRSPPLGAKVATHVIRDDLAS